MMLKKMKVPAEAKIVEPVLIKLDKNKTGYL